MFFLKGSIRSGLLAGAAVGAMCLWCAGGAAAQETVPTQPAGSAAPEDPRDVKIRALEHAVEDLQAEVSDLKASQSAGIKEVRQAVAAQPQVTFAGGKPQIATADGSFKVAIRTIAQLDAAHYDVPANAPTDFSSGTNFRRARLGVDATVFKDWNLAIWGDFGGSGTESPILNQAWIEYAGFHPFGLKQPLRLRVGGWSTPTGLEDATPTADLLFLERPAVAELVRGFAGGDGRSGAGAFIGSDHWYASAVLTGDTVGAPAATEFGEQQGLLARLALNPISGKDYDVHIGANLTDVFSPPDTAAGPATAQAVRLRIQPEIRVDDSGARLVDTGAIAADGMIAYGLEGGASVHNFYVAGEWYKIDVHRTGVGAAASPFDPSFSGWYIQGGWTITGERHPWTSASGGFRGVRPYNNFDPKKGTWGAWELAARYSWLDLNDKEGVAGSAAPLGGIRGGKQDITTLGLNWYPNQVIRFLLDYQWIHAHRLNAAGGDISESLNVVSLRSQFAF
jgi:phosphate-selective porin OprO/OprP